MKCSDLKLELFLRADGASGAGTAALDAHLQICPLCRDANAESLQIRTSLSQMRRPEIPLALRNNLKRSIRSERRESPSRLTFSPGIGEWLRMQMMPYAVGVCASVIIGFMFLTMMFSGMLKPGNLPMAERSGDSTVMLASNSNPFSSSGSAEISPAEFARTRFAFASESPSVNPQGALIALTRSLVRAGMTDDEVVVVADVFGNGLAQIAEVVEPSRDRRAVEALQKALESDPAFAAFLPANIETRPASVRVILKFQSVNVSTGTKRPRNRR